MKAVSIDRKNFIAYPTNRVVGTIARRRPGAGCHRRAAPGRIRPRGHRHPAQRGGSAASRSDRRRTWIPGAVSPDVDSTFDLEEFKHLTQYAEAVRAGLFVIMVLAKRRGLRISAAEILHQYGADFVEFYGRWSCEDVPATAQTSPEDIPALFARAWNGRDPAALPSCSMKMPNSSASTGRPLHDRAAIRKWHAARLERELNTSTVVTSDTQGQAAVDGVRRRPRAIDAFGREGPGRRTTADARRSSPSSCIERATSGCAHRPRPRT